MCFRRFFLNNGGKFTLQKIDQILVSESTTCADRIVNPNCVPKWGRIRSIDNLALSSVGILQGGDFTKNKEELHQEKRNYMQEMHDKAKVLILSRNKMKQKAARQAIADMKDSQQRLKTALKKKQERIQKLARETYLRNKELIEKKKKLRDEKAKKKE